MMQLRLAWGAMQPAGLRMPLPRNPLLLKCLTRHCQTCCPSPLSPPPPRREQQVMPMAMLVGTQLPKRLALPWVLLAAFFLGVLVTYAEPAIAALRPLAALVDPHSAPYL
jgi:hypothetical protein